MRMLCLAPSTLRDWARNRLVPSVDRVVEPHEDAPLSTGSAVSGD
jgi:hypothetical protein